MKRIKVSRRLIGNLKELAFLRGFRTRHDERFNFEDYETFYRDDGPANEPTS